MKKGLVFDIHRGTTHDGPGMRTTLFFKGCPLHCAWCQNPESINSEPELVWDVKKCIGCMECVKACPNQAITVGAQGMQIEERDCQKCLACVDSCPSKARNVMGTWWEISALVKASCKDKMFFDTFSGGVTVSGGEPIQQGEFLCHFLERLKQQGVNTALDTSGFGTPDIFERVYPFVDTFLYDIKFVDEEMHQKYTRVSNKIILENLKAIADLIRQRRDAKLWIRTPLIPGATATEKNIEEIGFFMSTQLLDVVERWELCAFNHVCRDKYIKMGLCWEYRDVALLDSDMVEKLTAVAEKYVGDLVVVSGLTGNRKDGL